MEKYFFTLVFGLSFYSTCTGINAEGNFQKAGEKHQGQISTGRIEKKTAHKIGLSS